MVAIPWRFKSSYPHHVAADGISFAATFLQKSLLTHSVAAPLRIEPAVSGLRFGFLPEWGIFFVNALHVVADCVSFATAFFYFKTNAVSHSLRRASDSPAKAAGFAGGYKPPLAHAVAAPHQIDPVLRRAAIRDFGSAEIPVCPAMPRPAPASRLRRLSENRARACLPSRRRRPAACAFALDVYGRTPAPKKFQRLCANCLSRTAVKTISAAFCGNCGIRT